MPHKIIINYKTRERERERERYVGFQNLTLDVKRFVMSVDLEDLGEMGTLSVQSGSFLQGL
jgi:hypothetical protein